MFKLLRDSPIFRKFLLSAFLLLAAALLILDFYLTRYTASRETSSVERRLTAEGRILAGEIAAVPAGGLPRFAVDASQRAQARVTIIDPSGVVLADSEHSRDSMENHATRPEVLAARQDGTGAAIRHSATLDRDFSYVALAFTYRNQPGHVLRLALPLEQLDEAVAAVRWRILIASMSTAALALVLAYVFASRISQRIRRLQLFAEQLTQSQDVEVLPPEPHDELGSLSRALNRMGSRLRDLIDTMRVEFARREAILTSMVDGVLAVDERMRVLFCNDSFAKTIGGTLPAERFPLLSLVRDATLVDMFAKVLATGQPLKRRVRLPVAQDRAFEIQVAPLVSTQRDGAIAILHEITEVERLERVRKDFVANVSHELRTPLTAIQGYAEVLLEGALEDPDNSRRFLETIRAHASRLNNIAADLLTLSELDSGAPAAPLSSVSLKNSLQTAMRTVEPEARLRGIQVICEEIEDIQVRGHQLRLEQAFVNLLDNAIKFNHKGGEVRMKAIRTSGEHASVIIADTGVGIPAQDITRIFERFYRVDKARSRQVGGTGLGLAIVKHTVELMGGRVEVNSELGRGSTFTVLLPV